MQELISRVVQSVGIDEATAKPAIGVVLNLLKNMLPDGLASSLMSSLPGAEALSAEADQGAGSGGLGGMLGGAVASLTGGSTGAPSLRLLASSKGLALALIRRRGWPSRSCSSLRKMPRLK